jgi:mono/diheme cytochrome c family protein
VGLVIIFLVACSNSSDRHTDQSTIKTEKASSEKSTSTQVIDESVNNEGGDQNESDAASEAQDDSMEIEKEETEVDEEQEVSMTPEQIAKADEILADVEEEAVAMVDSKKLFRTHCAICHGFKGNMMVNGAKDLTKSKIALNEAVAQIYHGKGLMTPYKGILEDTEIVALAKYAEGLRK